MLTDCVLCADSSFFLVELEQSRSDWEVQEAALKLELERMRQQVDQRERDRQLDMQRQAWVESEELAKLRQQVSHAATHLDRSATL